VASYIDLLRDPRWQRKRLEILQRDGFTCQECGAIEKPLHVHHKVYQRGKKPWEYDGGSLTTLCEDCHGFETVLDNRIKDCLALDRKLKMQILGYIEAIGAIRSGENVGVFSYENACGIGDAIGGLSGDEVTSLIQGGDVNPSKIRRDRKKGS